MHLDFTDGPTISPILPYILRRMGVSEDSAGTLRETNRVMAAFFAATLRGDESGWTRVGQSRPPFRHHAVAERYCSRPTLSTSIEAECGRRGV